MLRKLGFRKKPRTLVPQPVLEKSYDKQITSLWQQAYEFLRIKDSELIDRYEKLAQSLLGHSHVFKPTKEQLEQLISLGRQKIEDGRTAGIQDGIAKVAELVEWSKAWIDQAVQNNPQAAIAWSIISLGIPFLTRPASANKACKEAFTFAAARMDYYIELQNIILEAGKQLEPTIVQLYMKILEVQVKSVLRFFRGSLSNFAMDLIKTDWDDMIKELKTTEEQLYRDMLSSASSHTQSSLNRLANMSQANEANMHSMISVAEEQLKLTKDIRDYTKKQVELSEDDRQRAITAEERECLQSFRLREASSTEDQSYESLKKRNACRVEGTCQWVLKHPNFQQWIAQEYGPLFVTADPGCGKSVLAAYLIDEVLVKPVCYFFFKDQVQNRLYQALCALLHQMLSQRPDLIRHVMPRYQRDGAAMFYSAAILWDVFRETVDKFGALTVVLDALDECADGDRRELLNNLREYLPITTAKFLLTSRPYDQVTDRLQGLVDIHPDIRITGENLSRALSPEIDLVIQARVDRMAKDMGLTAELKKHIMNRLLEVPQQTYLWVYLVLDYLEDGFKKTPSAFDDHIKHLPTSVNVAYEGILSKSPVDAPKTRLILSIMLVVEDALDLGQLHVALEIALFPDTETIFDFQFESPSDFSKTLRRECGLLATIVDGKVYFFHQTVRDFLLGDASRTFWQGAFDHANAHRMMAKICVKCLLLAEKHFPGTLSINDTGALYDDPRFLKPYMRLFKISSIFARFMLYANEFWDRHYEYLRSGDISPELENKINQRTQGGHEYSWLWLLPIQSESSRRWFTSRRNHLPQRLNPYLHSE